MTTEKPIKVLVLGGGVGAFTAAFDLTSGHAGQKRFEVTLLQHGWRMGGKAAGGRFGDEKRVQEHGLHLLMGFYDHAFRVIRQCYGELRPEPHERFQSWKDAFLPQRYVTLGSAGYRDGAKTIDFLKLPGTPGDPRPEEGIVDHLLHLLRWLEERFVPRAESLLSLPQRKAVQAAFGHFTGVLGRFRQEAMLLRGIGRVELLVARKTIEALHHKVTPWDVHAVQLGMAFIHGLILDVLLKGATFEAINHLDFRDWLRKNDASEEVVQSPIVTGFYDLAFAYEDGARDKPRVEAGTLAKTILRMAFTYRDAPLFRMQAGMGDVVFGPLYRVLQSRGADLKFFHRVQSVTLSPDGKTVDSVRVTRQVKLKNGRYDPMENVEGVYSWPAEPYWDQIEDGAAVRDRLRAQGLDLESAGCTEGDTDSITYKRGEHFDVVVMGLSVGAFPIVCADLIDKHPEWKAMVRSLKTVRTQAAQLWLNKTATEMGFERDLTVQSGGAPTFDSWGDMGHLLRAEQWGEGDAAPKTIAYLCTVLPEGTNDPAGAYAEVKGNLRYWLDHQALEQWPSAASRAGKFDDSLFVMPRGTPSKEDALGAQYIRANIDPTERYVLSLPGSSRFRRDADDSRIDNLYLAGDWVKTSINGGASEAAFEAGAACAKAMRARYLGT